jgi:hypothetical protein
MSDDTGAFPDAPRSHDRLEAEALARVDLVVATARRLLDGARRAGARRVLYLPNACDPAPFAAAAPRAAGAAEPPGLAGLPRPRAVYAGAIDSWFDAALLGEVARRLPRWGFALIGPARGRAAAVLAGLANVRLLGPRPYAALPDHFAAADAGIVPFVLDRMTHAIHPIKVYEYLAAGLPVVATPMEETAAMGAPIRLAADAAAFAAALEAAAGEGEEARAARRAFASRNTWDDRFATLMRVLEERDEPPLRSAAGGRS